MGVFEMDASPRAPSPSATRQGLGEGRHHDHRRRRRGRREGGPATASPSPRAAARRSAWRAVPRASPLDGPKDSLHVRCGRRPGAAATGLVIARHRRQAPHRPRPARARLRPRAAPAPSGGHERDPRRARLCACRCRRGRAPSAPCALGFWQSASGGPTAPARRAGRLRSDAAGPTAARRHVLQPQELRCASPWYYGGPSASRYCRRRRSRTSRQPMDHHIHDREFLPSHSDRGPPPRRAPSRAQVVVPVLLVLNEPLEALLVAPHERHDLIPICRGASPPVDLTKLEYQLPSA